MVIWPTLLPLNCPRGLWMTHNDVMNGYLGKDDLTFVFLNTFAYEFSNFSHTTHISATISQVRTH